MGWDEEKVRLMLQKQQRKAADLLGTELSDSRGLELLRSTLDAWRDTLEEQRETVLELVRASRRRRVKSALEGFKACLFLERRGFNLTLFVVTWRAEAERRKRIRMRIEEMGRCQRLALLETFTSEWLRVSAALRILMASSKRSRLLVCFGGLKERTRWRRKLKGDAHTRAVELGEEAFAQWKKQRDEEKREDEE
mmetsp:Transcript_32631/g.103324  ORF Transcript_32631/g.103324 Transcript_32631/m.103324 type:complete len:195 (+) Transcript_32631:110-694(+)